MRRNQSPRLQNQKRKLLNRTTLKRPMKMKLTKPTIKVEKGTLLRVKTLLRKINQTIKRNDEDTELEWTYKETKHLFELCQAFELKWPIIHDRFPNPNRTAEDLKEQFYRICIKILENQENKTKH